MRQAGVAAAAALYALDHHRERVAEDHANARRLAQGIRDIDGLTLEPDEVETNMLFFRVDESLGTAADFRDRLGQQGLLVLATAPQVIRMVTHLDVGPADVQRALAILEATCSS
jgi:threonine aldolase